MAAPHGVPFPEVERQKILLIIGTNVPEVFVPLEVRHGSLNDPLAIRSCLGLLSLVEQATEQHSCATMFTTSIQQPTTCPSTTKLDLSGSQSLLAPPNLTSPCRLKTGTLNGLSAAQFQSRMTITAWDSFGNMIHLTLQPLNG